MKQAVKSVKQYHTPDRSSWVIGLAATALTFGGLVYINKATDYHYLEENYTSLKLELAETSDWTSVVEEPRYQNFVKNSSGDLKNSIRSLVEVSRLLGAEEYEDASSFVGRAGFPRTRDPKTGEVYKEKLMDILDTATEARSESGLRKDSSKIAAGKKAQMLLEGELIASELSAVFSSSLELEPTEFNFEAPELLVYKEGMLEGLPVLTGLPEKIENKKQFSSLMDGKYVDQTGIYLDDLKRRSQKLSLDYKRFVTSEKILAKKNKDLTEKLATTKSDSKKVLLELIALETKPKISESEISAKNNLEKIVTFVKKQVGNLSSLASRHL